MRPRSDQQHTFKHELGGGTFGTVWLAYDEIAQEYVAVKIPKVSSEMELSRLEPSLRAEMELLMQLRPHPHIVEPRGVKQFIMDAAQYTSLSCILTQFVPGWQETQLPTNRVLQYGCDLGQYLRGRDGRASIDRVKLIQAMAQVCNGLFHAYNKGIVHRDIKPSNIMIHVPEGIVKLVDWGVAKNISEWGAWGQQSGVGTIPYMAPEVFQLELVPLENRDQHLPTPDHRADLYSLAVTIIRITIGSHPFDNNERHVKNLQWRGELTRQLESSLGADLTAVVMKAVAWHPKDRFQTAQEMELALKELLIPAHKPPPPIPDPPPKPGPPDPLPNEIIEKLEEAQRELGRGSTAKGLEIYRALIADNPTCVDAYLGCSRTLTIRGEYEEALASLSQGLLRVPDNVELLYERGIRHDSLKRRQEAQRDFEAVLDRLDDTRKRRAMAKLKQYK